MDKDNDGYKDVSYRCPECTDCNDYDNWINPGQPDCEGPNRDDGINCDGLDNNCNKENDEMLDSDLDGISDVFDVCSEHGARPDPIDYHGCWYNTMYEGTDLQNLDGWGVE